MLKRFCFPVSGLLLAATIPLFGQLTPPGGGGGVTTFYQSITPAICVAGAPGYGVAIPVANAPTAACVNTGTTNLGVLQIASATTNQSFQIHFELPPDWIGPVDLEVAIRSTDSTHASTLNIKTVCLGAVAIDNPTFNAPQALTITAGASSIRTLGTLSSMTMTGCSAGNELVVNITGDTTNLTGTLDVISLRFKIVR